MSRKSLIGTGEIARLASFADSLGQGPSPYDQMALVDAASEALNAEHFRLKHGLGAGLVMVRSYGDALLGFMREAQL